MQKEDKNGDARTHPSMRFENHKPPKTEVSSAAGTASWHKPSNGGQGKHGIRNPCGEEESDSESCIWTTEPSNPRMAASRSANSGVCCIGQATVSSSASSHADAPCADRDINPYADLNDSDDDWKPTFPPPKQKKHVVTLSPIVFLVNFAYELRCS